MGSNKLWFKISKFHIFTYWYKVLLTFYFKMFENFINAIDFYLQIKNVTKLYKKFKTVV